MRFRLRTLLIVMLVAGTLPWLTVKYLEWQRDSALRDWRAASVTSGPESAAERAAVDRYFAARQRLNDVKSLFGGMRK